MKRLLATAASAAVIIGLAGCTADDAPPALSQQELEEVRSDPRVVKAERIIARADTVLVPAAYFDIVVSADGRTQETSMAYRGSCEGVRCYLSGASPDDTLEFSLEELSFTEPDSEERITRFDLGERRGFDTVLVEAADELSGGVSGVEAGATAVNYGFWGEHGFAATVIIGGSISVEDEGETVRGEFRGALSYVAGDVTGSNPTEMGSATWRGIAEAVDTRTYRSRAGTATIAIPDLARPSVDVDILIDERRIGSAAWRGIALSAGRYETGINGRDRLIGDFYGPSHQETYGVFDTGAYIGSFGASR